MGYMRDMPEELDAYIDARKSVDLEKGSLADAAGSPFELNIKDAVPCTRRKLVLLEFRQEEARTEFIVQGQRQGEQQICMCVWIV